MWKNTRTTKPRPGQRQVDSATGSTTNEETLLEQAIRRARAGDFDEALALLDRLNQGGVAPTAEALDLRAKINAQLGFDLIAERCWALATQADPTNPLYPLALERLRQRQRRRRRVHVPGLLVGLAGAVALTFLVGLGLQQQSEIGDLDARLAGLLTAAQQEREATRDQLAVLVAKTQDSIVQVAADVTELSGRVDQELPLLARQPVLDEKLDALEQHDTQVNDVLTTLARHEPLSERLTALEQQQAQIAEVLPRLAQHASLIARLDALESSQGLANEEWRERLRALDASAQSLATMEQAAREQMRQAIAAVDASLAELKARLGSQMNELGAGVESLSASTRSVLEQHTTMQPAAPQQPGKEVLVPAVEPSSRTAPNADAPSEDLGKP